MEHPQLLVALGFACLEDGALGGREQAVEAPEHGEREDDLAVLVALAGATQEVADAPDKGR